MRLFEVEDIKSHEFTKYFRITPNQRKNIVLSSDGIIIDGDCTALKRHFREQMNKLPFKFKKINGDFILDQTFLTTLEGCPEIIDGTFQCYDNKLSSLVGGPTIVKGSYLVAGNPIVSLDGLPEEIGDEFNISYQRTLPLLRLLRIKGLDRIEIFNDEMDHFIEIENILNNHIGKGRLGMLLCAAELTRAGFKNNANI